MKKCTGDKCPMQMGYDFENCHATEKCPYRTWPVTNADRIRAATNQQLAKLLYDNQKEFCRLMYKNLGFEDELNFSEDYSDILAWLNAPSKGAEVALETMKDEC